jgi:sporulation protein YlmC with PRC-barrel domain
MPILSTSTLSGDNVVNLEGEDLGSIQDFMVDTENGRVVYAVLSFGGFLGFGDKLFAVPLDAMRVDTANHRLMLDVDKARLEDAPGFDKDNWPASSDRSFVEDVYSHYGLPSYYERGHVNA